MSKEAKVDKKRKRKARAALILFLKRLRAHCGTFKKADEWYGFIKKYLNPLLDEYREEIPKEVLTKIKETENLADTTSEAANRACRNLGREIEKAVKMLPGGGSLGWLVTLIAAAIVLGVLATYLNRSAITVIIKNEGCLPLTPIVYLPVKIPGLELPTTPIPSGGQGTAKLPPVTFTVNNSLKGTIRLTALGMTLTFELSSGGIDVLFDGSSLLGRTTTISLIPSSTHTVIARCR